MKDDYSELDQNLNISEEKDENDYKSISSYHEGMNNSLNTSSDINSKQGRRSDFTPVYNDFEESDDGDDLEEDDKQKDRELYKEQKKLGQMEYEGAELKKVSEMFLDDMEDEFDSAKEAKQAEEEQRRIRINQKKLDREERHRLDLERFQQRQIEIAQEKEIAIAQKLQKKLDEAKQREEEYQKNTLPVQKVADYLKDNVIDEEDPKWEPLKNFIKEDAPNLYLEAAKEEAPVEKKLEWARYTLGLHKRLGTFLADIQKSNPEQFAEDDRVVALNAAYGINSKLCAEAIAQVPDLIIQDLFEEAYLNVRSDFKEIGLPGKAEETKEKIAKLLYLGKLKYEYDNVHGTEEEVKAWKEEILTELMSDRFEENAKKYQDSEIFKAVTDAILREENRFSNTTLDRIIQEALVKMADKRYHDVYSYFADGVQNEQEKEHVIKATDELDEMKALADTVENMTVEEPNHISISFHPYFDTQFIKKRANLYGKQTDFAQELKQKADDETTLDRNIKREVSLAKLQLDLHIKSAKNELEDSPIYKKLLRIDDYERNIERIRGRLNELANSPKDGYKNLKGEEVDPENTFSDMLVEALQKKAAVEEELRDDYSKEEVELIKKKRADYEKALADYDGNLEKATRAAEEKAKNDFQAEKDRNKVSPETLRNEAASYKALMEGNAGDKEEKIGNIKRQRFHRDQFYKKEYPNLYKEQKSYSGISNYNHFSVESKEAVSTMKSEYLAYKTTYNIVDVHLDKQFDDNQRKYAELEEKYRAKTPIQKPDRSNLKINSFKAPDVPLNVGLEHVVIDNNIRKYENIPQVVEDQIQNQNDSTACIAVALDYVEIYRKEAFWGTEEYKKIYNALKDLDEKVAAARDEKKVIIPNCRKLIVMMNDYIDRKNDELEQNGRESEVARKRRCAMISARTQLQQAVYTLNRRNRVSDKDYIYDDLRAELENAVALTKKRTQETDRIINALRSKNRESCLDQMYLYAKKYAARYKGANGRYSFRMTEIDPEGRRRIPLDEQERLFKTVLVGLEKFEKDYLQSMKENHPDYLEEVKFRATYMGNKIDANSSLDKKLGINVHPEDYELDLTIQKKDSLEQYANQFAMHYRALIGKMRFNNATNRVMHGMMYSVKEVLTNREENYLVESALSAQFLANLNRGAQNNGLQLVGDAFDFAKTEEERQKLVSLAKEADIFGAIKDNLEKEFDLDKEEGDGKHMLNKSTQSWEGVKNPNKFMEKVVLPAIKAEVIKNFNKTVEQLSKTKFSKTALRQNLKALEANVKLAKSLGLSRQLDTLNNQFTHVLRGATLRETVDNLKKAIEIKIFKKPVEPVQGIRL